MHGENVVERDADRHDAPGALVRDAVAVAAHSERWGV
jgi:hypothetical protein